MEPAILGLVLDSSVMSGVKTEMTGTMLSWMQDHSADGLIFIGPPGAAKSAVGKAAGATAGIPTVAFDLSAMQSSLVGGSGKRLRAALQVVDAISQGRSLWIATCNSITSRPPERDPDSHWVRSSLTSHRPKSARRFGTSTSPNGIGQPTFPMTRVGPARRLRSVPGKPG